MTNIYLIVAVSAAMVSLPPACSERYSRDVAQEDGAASQVIAHGQKADLIVVDKSDRTLILHKGGKILIRYDNIRFGDAPEGHKQFEGDERTPEGNYTIDARNPQSSYHLSLRISYPNAKDREEAARKGRSPGGDIFIHGQPNGRNGPKIDSDWTDGCIAVGNREIEQIWDLVDDGTLIKIEP